MVAENKNDWDPVSYASFRGLRLRPALDLLAQVGALPDGDVIDLGCGDGAVGPALRQRFAGRRLIGVDASASMLAKAQGYDALVQADVATWAPETPPALIFSNACLNWLSDHPALLNHLIGKLVPGGALAVQMPRQYAAPSHALIRKVAGVHDFTPPVSEPQVYMRLLQGAGEVSVWESEYLQSLASVDHGHPVRHFTQSTVMRPYVENLSQDAEAAFLTAYDEALEDAYPKENDGSVLFAFNRLFFVLRKG
ncbi:trans-aconitate 2-methyltransferase [Octadecabacter temperatus]|uniref:Trans-aconitate 2-methyltransferase n=1 Tax=Octadecabacter temperatus TaxID=1458307 RepID=A0A0K0Y2V6_9RHOB|nr:methyltransferase domain-containing protein [Octadecabacter temperatus]AKS45279.1 Trans-aconitate 2-methyltransferase [Octadecabacter temperatus]SIN89685.1 trans-aconitate 2-methyltransferase [Octadecabacter temperatus]